jgi:hypothetical protein
MPAWLPMLSNRPNADCIRQPLKHRRISISSEVEKGVLSALFTSPCFRRQHAYYPFYP